MSYLIRSLQRVHALLPPRFKGHTVEYAMAEYLQEMAGQIHDEEMQARIAALVLKWKEEP